MVEVTAAELTNGECVLIALDETAGLITFTDEHENRLTQISVEHLATVGGGLTLRLGEGLFLSMEATAQLKQWVFRK